MSRNPNDLPEDHPNAGGGGFLLPSEEANVDRQRQREQRRLARRAAAQAEQAKPTKARGARK